MNVDELVKYYRMDVHEENGAYLERHYEAKGEVRPASGSIYYYLGPEELAQFHVIDCDEYWAYAGGTPLEIWQFSPEGELTRSRLGLGPGLEPLAYIPAGTVFGAKHFSKAEEGTFVSCITVPRFDYAGWRLFSEQEITVKYPEAKEFFVLDR